MNMSNGVSLDVLNTQTETHSPCRDLAVVHVGRDDHACFTFIALQEEEEAKSRCADFILWSA